MLEGAAGRADYPVTHDPREGLHAPRELDPVAHGERERADGWRRFNGAEGAVWRKDYVSDKGVPLSAVIVERDLPGKTSDRVDIYLSRRDWPGELLYEKRLPADAGQQLRESLDKRLDSVAKKPAEAGRPQPSTRQSEHAERFMEQLAPRLGQLGMNQRQIHTLAAAAAKEASRYENQGPVGQFIFGRDGNTIALRQEYPPLREFSVAQALSQSPAEHWREAVAMNTAMRDAAFVSPTPSPQARPEAAIARG